MERGGQGITDAEKVLESLDSIRTSNVAIGTYMELVCQGVTFQTAVTSLSTSIVTIFPFINVKGRKAIVFETGTSDDGNVSNATHMNDLKFTCASWKTN